MFQERNAGRLDYNFSYALRLQPKWEEMDPSAGDSSIVKVVKKHYEDNFVATSEPVRPGSQNEESFQLTMLSSLRKIDLTMHLVYQSENNAWTARLIHTVSWNNPDLTIEECHGYLQGFFKDYFNVPENRSGYSYSTSNNK